MKCVSYTRAASWARLEGSESIQEQNEAIASWVIRHEGFEIIKKYSDRKQDVTAQDGFMEMIKDGMERKFDCVVIKNVAFIASNMRTVRYHLLDTLYAAGIHLAVVDDDIDTSKMDKQEVIAYFEKKKFDNHGDIFRKWLSERKEGFVLSNSIPYGYARKDGEDVLVKDNAVSAIVDEIFKRTFAGEAAEHICGWLNWENIDTPHDYHKKVFGKEIVGGRGYWDAVKLRRIIRNPAYTGAAVDGKQHVVARQMNEAYVTEEQFLSIPGNRIIDAVKDDGGRKIKKKYEVM